MATTLQRENPRHRRQTVEDKFIYDDKIHIIVLKLTANMFYGSLNNNNRVKHIVSFSIKHLDYTDRTETGSGLRGLRRPCMRPIET